MNPVLPRLNSFIPDSSTLWAFGWGMGLAVSPQHVVFIVNTSSHFSLAPVWTAPVWLLPTGCSSWRIAPEWVLSKECSPSGMDCCRMEPPQIQKTCSCVDFSPYPTVSARSLLPRGCSVIPAPPWSSPGCRGTPALGSGASPLLSDKLSCVCGGSIGTGWKCVSSKSYSLVLSPRGQNLSR